MSRIASVALAAAIVGLAGSASAQQPAQPPAPPQRDFSKTEIKTTDLGDNTYMLQGEGGNITLAVGADGAIMVDSEFAPLHDKIKTAIEKITNSRSNISSTRTIIGDHTGGRRAVPQGRRVVVANVNVRKRLAAGTTNGLTGAKRRPVEPDALPTKTYTKSDNARSQGTRGRVARASEECAHRRRQLRAVSGRQRAATGDIFTNGRYPNIDFANGGNIKGMIAGVDTISGWRTTEPRSCRVMVPLASKADLEAYRTMLTTARDRMAEAGQAGQERGRRFGSQTVCRSRRQMGAQRSGEQELHPRRLSLARRQTAGKTASVVNRVGEIV